MTWDHGGGEGKEDMFGLLGNPKSLRAERRTENDTIKFPRRPLRHFPWNQENRCLKKQFITETKADTNKK